MLEIKKLPTNRWKDYKNLRLEALKSDTIAFGSSYEEEKYTTEIEWKRKIKNALFAMSNDKPIGMLVYVFEHKIKTKHIANIYGVYVRREFRGKGVGKKLLESAILLIKNNRNIIKIDLNVNPKQKAAVKLYEKYGFKPIGILKKDIYVNGKFYDEMIMEKML